MSVYRTTPRMLLVEEEPKPTWEDYVDLGFKTGAAVYGFGVSGAIVVWCVWTIIRDLFLGGAR